MTVHRTSITKYQASASKEVAECLALSMLKARGQIKAKIHDRDEKVSEVDRL